MMARYTKGKFEDYGDYLRKKIVAIGFQIEGDAKRNCPVDTGRLRSSISTNWTNSGMATGKVDGRIQSDGIGNPANSDKDKFTVVVGTNVVYGIFIELGTKYIQPVAMLRRAFEKYRNKLTFVGGK
jgi:hypothetical protein